MAIEIVNTVKAPAAIGPYSQAVISGGFVFTSGQIPMDPISGEIVTGGIEEQTHRVLQNLSAVLEASGVGLKDVIKTTIFLKNMDYFTIVNAVYGEYFSSPFPARSTIQAAKLPRDVEVEIEAVAKL